MTNLNFSDNLAAQDMIKIVMKEKDLSVKAAIEFSINHDMHKEIIEKKYGSIALNLWGHGDAEREWDVLDEPIIDIEFDELREDLINDITKKEKVDIETAVSYFLIFTMDYLGYHI
ncbi:MAG: hypothetical protein GX096_05710 [Clostridiales bacterium]|nr:hypothetical protein [Clostridiales bacterium]